MSDVTPSPGDSTQLILDEIRATREHNDHRLDELTVRLDKIAEGLSDLDKDVEYLRDFAIKTDDHGRLMERNAAQLRSLIETRFAEQHERVDAAQDNILFRLKRDLYAFRDAAESRSDERFARLEARIAAPESRNPPL